MKRLVNGKAVDIPAERPLDDLAGELLYRCEVTNRILPWESITRHERLYWRERGRHMVENYQEPRAFSED
jgi:hypothetical protein